MSTDSLSSLAQIISFVIELLALFYGGFKAFAKLSSRLERLEEQYRPNGGSSMRDAINRIELKVSKLEGKFEQHLEDEGRS